MSSSDPSLGWDRVATRFASLRSDTGSDVVQHWAGQLPPGGSIVDIGCGTGWPIARILADAGLAVSGIDPSPTLLAAFRKTLPGAPAACEPVQTSSFFGRTFDGVVAIGLLFLLDDADQHSAIARIAGALRPGGRLLFSAPRRACHWHDTLTGRMSRSLGEGTYRALLAGHRLDIVGMPVDSGGNDYFDAVARRSDR
ncbi:class I SAM-dependent methyltransferase [Sphingomonas sp. 2R-10]|uniref:class I SAM-dependent methyltransferase n=1 Tax=Sphingomonas sp. 2R-10 TaxID=3045148 RepID=UPI0024B99B29|nr:class I SAM-dependent methyltransferase [Sphingomonas sp. 2R-10]MDJ0276740.1 class I SAM-dependent methyltransferase [Sphingomonas sp. 2R-10]